MSQKRFQNYYYFSSLFFAAAFIVVLTVKMIFAWNPPTAGAPGPSGQTLYSDSSNNIGIGTFFPGSKLEVFSTSSDSILKLSRGPGTTTSTIFKVGADTAFVIQNQSTDMFAIKSGNVGIGTVTPNDKLTIEGGISVKELDSAPSATSGYGKIYALTGAGNDSYAKLLLHADGIGASFTDSSASAKTITANGDVTQSVIQSKFGGKSGYFDGSGDYLSVPDSDDWNFGSGDFTIDTWVYLSGNQEPYIVTQWGDSGATDQQFGIYTEDAFSTYIFYYFTAISSVTKINARASLGSASSFNNGWHHIAYVRYNNTSYLYKDGVSLTLTTNTNNSPYTSDISSSLYIGQRGDGYFYLNGYLDEVRISKGIARWTSNFTPPTSSYAKARLFFKSSTGEEIQL
jgi:hypothetical protein